MKALITLVGLVLIIIGIASFAYQGFTYTKTEKIAEIGNIQVTADTEKTVSLSPVLGGLSLVAGLALIVIGRRNGK